jgi:hypothetical protein
MKKILILLAVVALASLVSANWIDDLEERIIQDLAQQDLEERSDDNDDELNELKRALFRRNKDYLTAQKYVINQLYKQ